MIFRVIYVCKEWHKIVKEADDRGELISSDIKNPLRPDISERMKKVTTVVFLLNTTKVGDYACCYAANLVVVHIPEGVQSIGKRAFLGCTSLTTVSFPKTLTKIGREAFRFCSSLDNVDLHHTNLRVLCGGAFAKCRNLSDMTIPDSLRRFGVNVFIDCPKFSCIFSLYLNIYVDFNCNLPDTSDYINCLRIIQLLPPIPKGYLCCPLKYRFWKKKYRKLCKNVRVSSV
mmetsp:Transcript_14907/g.27687  ORF Transcript_14907/g.27687 Transcript_14907/m.27687 type:complete len:229 (+) Transcript_14907:904-1590(+)